MRSPVESGVYDEQPLRQSAADHDNSRGPHVHQDPFQPFKRDSVDELIDFLTPMVESILARVEAEEFTTPDFIEAFRSDPAAERVYQEAIRRWGEDEHNSKLVIHGQVFPGALRKSSQIRWSGFAHEVEDDYAVPAWWTMVREG